MYDYVDRPVTALDHGGRFLVWTLRNWVRALADGYCPAAAVGPAFAKWDMMAAFPPFHRMLSILNAHGLDTIAVAPVECRHVAEHEAVLLSLIAGFDQRPPDRVRDTVALLVEEAHVGTMLADLSTLGGAMMDAGIFPRRPARQPHAPRRDGV
ncbi:hypothetical protein LWE61_10150 [Sphingobium sufflavum]|uniref:hypothetical protein n=1 Tax=Sphingobium sufflavum TaxID=1129547 RepID=UPI001F19D3C9|nr:hypothetical protein [Sphingobium sufflavum]MCE7796920.1 hypothetical protein [Sphingobium sufflavum]